MNIEKKPPRLIIVTLIAGIIGICFTQLAGIASLRLQEYYRDCTSNVASDSNNTTVETSDDKVVPVFYNLFVSDASQVSRVAQIVEEQFASLLPEHKVYVHSIGYPLAIPNTTLLEQHERGTEEATLHSLWEYCQLEPSSKVIYLHSKGSFHPSTENDIMRRFLTTGALSQQCLDLPDTCNVCSSRMSPLPHPHVPGNMWMARCEYIRRLINPNKFLARMGQVTSFDEAHATNVPWCYGLDRFSAEHWVLSHPSNRPCDLYVDDGYTWGYVDLSQTYDFRLAMAPRFPLTSFIHEASRIPGSKYAGSTLTERVVEYEQLYNETPSSDWWGWDFLLPDDSTRR